MVKNILFIKYKFIPSFLLLSLSLCISGNAHPKGYTSSPSLNKKDAFQKEFWSKNKNFYAVSDSQKKLITLYGITWRGKIGRSKRLWVIDSYFKKIWLTNCGEYLIASDLDNDLLPLSYSKDQAILSFFKEGKLIKEARVDQVIKDFSKLQKRDAGYGWGKYLGLNAAGHFVIEDIEGEKMLFDVKTGNPTDFEKYEVKKILGWKSYEDIMRCYEFQYPDDYLLKEHLRSDGTPAGWNYLKKRDYVIMIA